MGFEVISIRQIDAGLALIGLNRSDLADALGIKKSTLNAYFTGQASIPSGRLGEIQKWLENSGVLFTEDEGVKLNKAEVIKYEGKQGFVAFMTDVMETARKGNIEICVSNVDEKNWENNLPPEFADHYRTEMSKVKNINSKILVREGDDFFTASQFVQYRQIPASIFHKDTSFYAYGDKLALITFHDKSVQIVILKNKEFTDSFKVMFNAIWNNHGVIK
ncbi:MAG: XRE family transcriptional regulator [Alphaproteobacteria bacterium]|nr:XRE family transcriptional regulator [Alphaproteobacteria bacterium]